MGGGQGLLLGRSFWERKDLWEVLFVEECSGEAIWPSCWDHFLIPSLPVSVPGICVCGCECVCENVSEGMCVCKSIGENVCKCVCM